MESQGLSQHIRVIQATDVSYSLLDTYVSYSVSKRSMHSKLIEKSKMGQWIYWNYFVAYLPSSVMNCNGCSSPKPFFSNTVPSSNIAVYLTAKLEIHITVIITCQELKIKKLQQVMTKIHMSVEITWGFYHNWKAKVLLMNTTSTFPSMLLFPNGDSCLGPDTKLVFLK